jgi:hypothetical protein
MNRAPRVPGPLPNVRPHLPIDRLLAAVLAAMRWQTVRDRGASKALTKDANVRSESEQ